MITYSDRRDIAVEDFIDLLKRSTLAERRPVDDVPCMAGALENSNLILSAWDGPRLVGIARSMTDFHYACYLSDLAVDHAYQRSGIGRELIDRTQKLLGPRCSLILLAAPKANDYYARIGFTNNPRAWILRREETVWTASIDE